MNINSLWPSNMEINNTKAFPLIAWDDVCRLKYEGGLRIRKNKDVNKAAIDKLSWRILIDNDSI